jgi:hypothetical protein
METRLPSVFLNLLVENKKLYRENKHDGIMEHFKFGFEHEALIHIEQPKAIDYFIDIADMWRQDEEREHPYPSFLRTSLETTLREVSSLPTKQTGGTIRTNRMHSKHRMQTVAEAMDINNSEESQNAHFNVRHGPAADIDEQYWQDQITNCTFMPIRDASIMLRFLLASTFNQVGPNTFKVTQYYHGKPCWPRPLLPNKKLRDNGVPYYTVTEDASVKLSPTTDPMLFYRTFNEVIMDRPATRPAFKIIPNVEISSRILTIEDVNPNANTTFDAFLTTNTTANGAFSYWHNTTTSNHVHFSYREPSFYRNPTTLAKVCMVYWYFEPVLLLMVGHWRRRSSYAGSMREQFKAVKNYRNLFFNVDASNFEGFLSMMGLELDLPSIVFLFQTGRYSAFNMYNLAPNSIGTIEVRLKHGSNDPLENKMWMLLLAFMFNSAAEDQSWVTNQPNEFKKSAWNLFSKLELNREWETSTKLFLDDSTLYDLKVVLDVMRTYVVEDIVWNYWMSVLSRLHNIPAVFQFQGGGAKAKSKSPKTPTATKCAKPRST